MLGNHHTRILLLELLLGGIVLGKRLQNMLAAYRDVAVLTLIALPLGVLVGAVCAVFGRALLAVTDIRMEHAGWLLPFLGVIGTGIVWCYRKFGGQSGKGMSLIFEAGHGEAADIPLRLVPFTIAGTWLTHLFGGSAGREGVAIQIGGTIAHALGKRLPMQNGRKLLLVTGMAAGFAGLFQTPIAATFFALEVLTVGMLEHKALLPALAASFAASYTSNLLGLEKFSFALDTDVSFSWMLVLQLLLLGISFGAAGGLFSLCLHKMKKWLSGKMHNPMLRILVAGTAIGGLSLLFWNGRYAGLGTNLISMSFDTGIFPWDFALKLLFTVVTLSAGFQGGEVTPLFSIGASLGVVLAAALGLPAPFVAALGYAAVFGSATNTFIAPMLIGAEVFGFSYLPYFVVVCALAYVCNGNLSIYPLQRRKDQSGL